MIFLQKGKEKFKKVLEMIFMYDAKNYSRIYMQWKT